MLTSKIQIQVQLVITSSRTIKGMHTQIFRHKISGYFVDKNDIGVQIVLAMKFP